MIDSAMPSLVCHRRKQRAESFVHRSDDKKVQFIALADEEFASDPKEVMQFVFERLFFSGKTPAFCDICILARYLQFSVKCTGIFEEEGLPVGELLFTLGYGGSLVVIGLVMRAFLKNMEVTETHHDAKGTNFGEQEVGM
jgi:hypothetical protein